ncbi:hypothetical protein VUR80DRAFT_7723 [Thermomyces stellatus]
MGPLDRVHRGGKLGLVGEVLRCCFLDGRSSCNRSGKRVATSSSTRELMCSLDAMRSWVGSLLPSGPGSVSAVKDVFTSVTRLA